MAKQQNISIFNRPVLRDELKIDSLQLYYQYHCYGQFDKYNTWNHYITGSTDSHSKTSHSSSSGDDGGTWSTTSYGNINKLAIRDGKEAGNPNWVQCDQIDAVYSDIRDEANDKIMEIISNNIDFGYNGQYDYNNSWVNVSGTQSISGGVAIMLDTSISIIKHDSDVGYIGSNKNGLFGTPPTCINLTLKCLNVRLYSIVTNTITELTDKNLATKLNNAKPYGSKIKKLRTNLKDYKSQREKLRAQLS